MTAEAGARRSGELYALARAPVMDVSPIWLVAVGCPDLEGLPLEQPLDDPAGLASERGTQNCFGPERRRHVRNPEALATGVQVYCVLAVLLLDRDGEDRRRSEHRYARCVHAAHRKHRPLSDLCGVAARVADSLPHAPSEIAQRPLTLVAFQAVTRTVWPASLGASEGDETPGLPSGLRWLSASTTAKGEHAMTLAAPSPPTKSAGDDRRLLIRYHRDGDLRARDELVVRFLPMARRLARRYQRGSEPLEDLVQVASLGLVKAINRFDPDRATAFSSYAVPTMVGELKRYFRDFGWAVHVPRGMQERTVAVKHTVTRLSEELGRSPSATEIAAEIDATEEEVLEAFEAALAHDSLSLDAPRPGGDEAADPRFGDTVGEVDDGFELVELSAAIAPALRDLSERDRRILRMRFGRDMKQSEIAAEIGVSQMHVSRLLRRSLARLAAAADGEDQALVQTSA